METRQQAINENGQVVELIVRTVYDLYGREIFATDAYIQGTTVYGTKTTYDQFSRPVNRIRLKDVQVSLTSGETSLANSSRTCGEQRLSMTKMDRSHKQSLRTGRLQGIQYDALRRQTAVIGHPLSLSEAGLAGHPLASGGNPATHVRLRIEAVYDSSGRVAEQRLKYPSICIHRWLYPINRANAQITKHRYDEGGNLIKTEFADGTFVEATYDSLGRKKSETNQIGLTRTFEYDGRGLLKAVELPSVPNPANGGQLTRPRMNTVTTRMEIRL